MKKLVLLIPAILIMSCSTGDDECKTCEGQFVNLETGEMMHEPTDCDRTPPEGYAFVKCLEIDY